MKPSRDIALFTTTLPFPVLVSLILFLPTTATEARLHAPHLHHGCDDRSPAVRYRVRRSAPAGPGRAAHAITRLGSLYRAHARRDPLPCSPRFAPRARSR